MNSINEPLIEYILAKDYLESIIYAETTQKQEVMIDFLAEFLGIIKNLPNDAKTEVSKQLRKNSIGTLSLAYIKMIMDNNKMCKELQKKIVLFHLELLYYAFRRDLDYTRNCF